MTRLLYILLLIPASLAVPLTTSRPCLMNDYTCVGAVLAANSFCNTQVSGFIPKNYTIDNFNFETPYFNASYIDSPLSIANHDQCYLSEFYFNLHDNNLVLAIRCPNLIVQSNRVLIQHNVEREDAIYNFNYNATYPEVIMTVNLRPSYDIDMCKSQAFAYVSVMPTFIVDPNDKPTEDFLTRDLSFMDIYLRETFLYRANPFLRYFVNSKLCNFGCNF